MTPALPRRLRALVFAAATLALLPACDSGGTTDPPSTDQIVAGVNYTRLFAAPTAAEVDAVRQDWAGRNPSTAGTKVVVATNLDGAIAGVLQHTVTTANGVSVTHYAVYRFPTNDASNLPVVVVHHGGDDGLSIEASTANTGVRQWVAAFPDLAARTAQLWPVYRSESIMTGSFLGGGGPFPASGDPSPWDYDVDDSIAALTAFLERFSDRVDAGRVVALGMSRGANTALLHAVRDDRIDAVTDYYGPTDFFNDGARLLATGVLLGDAGALSLPGAQFLLDNVLSPLRGADGSYNADADYAGARLEVVRRSASAFTTDLPDTQVHHHVADGVVPYLFSQALDAAATANGTGGSFEFNTYGAPGTAPSALYHAPEVSPDMQPSLDVTEAFLLDAIGEGPLTRLATAY